MEASDGWRVIRHGATLRVEAEATAVANLEDLAAAVARHVDDGVEVVRVTGPMLTEPPHGLTTIVRRLGDIARGRGKRFDVGPI